VKRNLLFLAIILLIGFIVNSCDNNKDEKNDSVCTCDKGIVHIGNCNNICPNGKGNAPCTHKDPTTCGCPNGMAHEPENFPCCESDDCNCTIAEPVIRNFSINLDFPYSDGESVICNAIIQDARTKCGSANLEQLKVNGKNIVTIIEEAIMESFNTNATSNTQKSRFRSVFGREGGVTIIVDNSANKYKLKATDMKTIYFHIDYLKSTPDDIQLNILDAVTAMRNGDGYLPHEISKAIMPVPQYDRAINIASAMYSFFL